MAVNNNYSAGVQAFRPKPQLYIGIDPGVSTGFALWNGKRFVMIKTMMIHSAIELIKHLLKEESQSIFVRVEDARKRTWFGNTGKERLKGAGSVERDCKIWEDFLNDYKINYEMVHPKNNKTKLTDETFNNLTGWQQRTSVHGRDAAMLVFKL